MTSISIIPVMQVSPGKFSILWIGLRRAENHDYLNNSANSVECRINGCLLTDNLTFVTETPLL